MKPDMFIPIPMIHLFVHYVHWHLICSSFHLFFYGKKLFPGKDQKKRFNTCLHRVTKSNSHLYETIDVKTEELGSHSICKGATTYCCAGVYPGLPIVSVCFRAGWTDGRVKEQYLKYENVEYELVGGTLTRMPPTSCNFGISPVYFK